MSTTTVLAEFLLVGFLGLMTIMAGLLVYLDVDDVPEEFDLKGAGTLVVVVMSITSYLVGVLTHRVGQLISGRYVPFLTRFKWFTKLVPIRNQKEREKWLADYFFIYQNGSDNLVRRVEYGESLARIYRSALLWSLPLGILWSSWLAQIGQNAASSLALGTGLVLGLISWICLLIQVQNNRIGLQRARMVLGDQRRKS